MVQSDGDVELIQVIRTVLTLRGRGLPDSPYRRVTQYWSLDGKLLAEVDPEMASHHDITKT